MTKRILTYDQSLFPFPFIISSSYATAGKRQSRAAPSEVAQCHPLRRRRLRHRHRHRRTRNILAFVSKDLPALDADHRPSYSRRVHLHAEKLDAFAGARGMIKEQYHRLSRSQMLKLLLDIHSRGYFRLRRR